MGDILMHKRSFAAIPLLPFLLLTTTSYSAEEAYHGKALPPDSVLLNNTAYGYKVFGKVATDNCYSVFFLQKGSQDLHTTNYCRLDNDHWIYQPRRGGGTGIVMIITKGD